MPVAFHVRTVGLDSTRRWLQTLPARSKQAATRELRRNGPILARQMRNSVRVDTGKLKRSIFWALGGRARAALRDLVIGFDPRKSGAFNRRGKPYHRYVEYGSPRTGPGDFVMRRVIERNLTRILNDLHRTVLRYQRRGRG